MRNFLIQALILSSCVSLFAQKKGLTPGKAPQVLPALKKEYKYDTVPGDPTNTRIYTLDNGLTVYMSIYKNAPRVYTSIAVRAGSKNDPADATGLAHYLEHMLFKGTDKYGTRDFEKEKAELRKIDSLYEVYGQTKDTLSRKKLYHQIDSISGVAAKYSIANEYDKMLASIGASGTNAYTWVDQTVYINDVPSNQIKKWLAIEGERFRNPVMRIFHTELEAVYEEKNRSLDDDYNKLNEALFSGLWPVHPYGSQTTIGTIEHLKNPSLKKIKEFYKTYYVPNNMAVCLAGDLNPDSTIRWIDQSMGSWIPGNLPAYNPPAEKPIDAPRISEVTGPFPEMVQFAYRLPGAGTAEADLLTVVDQILNNGTAGIVDLDIMQKQKALSAGSYPMIMKEYAAHVFSGEPKEGQTLDQVKELLTGAIEKVKRGEFPDWLLEAIVNNMKLNEIKTFDNNPGRVNKYVESYINKIEWKTTVEETQRASRISKQQVIDFVTKYYQNNFVLIYKRSGIDSTVQKVEKPAITPVETNREQESEFLKQILATDAAEVKPVFLDYEKDILKGQIKNSIPVHYVRNEENKTFTLYYLFEMGSNNMKKLPIALDYLPYLGTAKYTPEQLKEEFYKLACSFGVFNSEDRIYVYLSGLEDQFEKGVMLFEELLRDAKPNPEALKNLTADILKKRADAKLDKSAILWQGLFNYAKYGPNSPFTNILSEKELNALKPEELITVIKDLTKYQHRVLYYGSRTLADLSASLEKLHTSPAQFKAIPDPIVFEELPTPVNKVFAVDYDMKQAEVLLVSRSSQYYKNMAPSIRIFNEYFGGGMSSILFQELRESRALAYSVFSSYSEAPDLSKHNYVLAYIGAQADKLPEAMDGLLSLMKAMPESKVAFNASKNAVLENIRTSRITKTAILFDYENAKRKGLIQDPRKDIFEKVSDMQLADVKRFHSTNLSDKNFVICVIGNKNLLDQKILEKYGPVKWLTLDQVFGY